MLKRAVMQCRAPCVFRTGLEFCWFVLRESGALLIRVCPLPVGNKEAPVVLKMHRSCEKSVVFCHTTVRNYVNATNRHTSLVIRTLIKYVQYR